MVFDRFFKIFSKFAGHQSRTDAATDEARLYVQRHHSFKLFLSAWNGFQETMSDLRYTLCCEHPFGLHRVRALCTSVAIQVFQCIKRLEELDPAPCDALFEHFNKLQNVVLAEFQEPESCLLGPQVLPLPLSSEAQANLALLDPATSLLETMRQKLPDRVPQGFVITSAGCQRFFHETGLQSEINRRIQVAGGLVPKQLRILSRQLATLVEETPLPEDLRSSVWEQIQRLQLLYPDKPMQLLFRGRIWPPDGSDDCGVVVWGPAVSLKAPFAEMEAAILSTLSRKQRAQSLVYRRARGLTDAGTGMCLTCFCVPLNAWGGTAQSCAPLKLTSQNTHLYGGPGLPQELEYSTLPVDRISVSRDEPHRVTKRYPFDKEHPVLDDATALEAAELTLLLEQTCGKPYVLTWVKAEATPVLMLMARPMTRPLPGSETLSSEIEDEPLLQGGFIVSPGRVSGVVCVAREWKDVLKFPQGGILVVPSDVYVWGSLIDRCAGIIAEKGFQCSRLASLAREFGKPAIFGLEGACSLLENGQRITLCADLKKVFKGRLDKLLPKKTQTRDYMPGSPVFQILEKACQHILPLTLNIDTVDFTAANCVTYHDIVSYCHERAVNSMFNVGSDKRHAPQRVKQLRDGVPKQFWVVNL
ncbi:MAG: phosphoenolpyruvate synthase, partial [Desulfovibrionaceae bacterium]|nr:phosphoenolpyruvate synthase [Desulfovibrionaceae bacterium]